MPKKKKEEIVEESVSEVVEEVVEKVIPNSSVDSNRADVLELEKKVNEIIDHINNA